MISYGPPTPVGKGSCGCNREWFRDFTTDHLLLKPRSPGPQGSAVFPTLENETLKIAKTTFRILFILSAKGSLNAMRPGA